ncbi:CHC2 zinc finger domain-containing protein [Solidesulfovibrio sp.]
MTQDILERYIAMGLTPKQKTGAEWAGPCPACGGNDRFLIWPSRDRFHCRGCKLQGDAIEFLRAIQGFGYGEACRELGRTPAAPSGRRATREPGARALAAPAWTPKISELPNALWQKRGNRFVTWAEGQLLSAPDVLLWLGAERGLTPRTVARFHLGLVPKDTYRDRTAWGLLQEFKPNGQPRRLWFPRGLVIPAFDTSGSLVRIKFRRPNPGPDEPRYIILPSLPKNTAPLAIAGTAAAWIVVESELDAMLLAQEAGDLVNVLALGSASLRPDAEAHARLEAAPIILLALDFDDAGNKAAMSWWPEHYPPDKLRIWPVPEGKDPTDAWRAGWDLRAWIEAGIPPYLLPARPVKIAAPVPMPEPARQDEGAHEQPQAEAPAAIAPSASRDDAVIAPPILPAAPSQEPHSRLSRPRKSKPTPAMVVTYKTGRRWILANQDRLLAHGWTRAGLFRAGQFRFPCGGWGLAWASAWGKPNVGGVSIAEDGTVVFELNEAGRVVRQTVQPR